MKLTTRTVLDWITTAPVTDLHAVGAEVAARLTTAPVGRMVPLGSYKPGAPVEFNGARCPGVCIRPAGHVGACVTEVPRLNLAPPASADKAAALASNAHARRVAWAEIGGGLLVLGIIAAVAFVSWLVNARP